MSEVTVHSRMVALVSLLLLVQLVQNGAGKEGNTTLREIGTSRNNTTDHVTTQEKEFRNHPDITEAITGLPFQWQQQQQRLLNGDDFSRQDPSVSSRFEDELQEEQGDARSRRESEANAAAVSEDYDDESDDSDMHLNSEDTASMGQHFFPSFSPVFPAPPLGHSRPSIFQEPAHSQRPALLRPQQNNFQPLNFGGGSFRETPYLHAASAAESSSTGILGSGNFGVIKGGTFYSDDNQQDDDYDGRGNHQFYSPYYYSNNGHGRPAFYNGGGASNPRPQNHRGGDFFANFRDFADINTPTKSSFSQYVVVYVNKNSSKDDNQTNLDNNSNASVMKPKNIIESLAMLDQQEKHNVPKKIDLETKSSITLSPTKQKLAIYQEKFSKQKNKKTKETTSSIPSKDLYEPLLALS